MKNLFNILGLAFMLLAPVSFSSSAEVSHSAGYGLKAVFLSNFVKFTEWPPGDVARNGDFSLIGILGKDPFGAALEAAKRAGLTIRAQLLSLARIVRTKQ